MLKDTLWLFTLNESKEKRGNLESEATCNINLNSDFNVLLFYIM